MGLGVIFELGMPMFLRTQLVRFYFSYFFWDFQAVIETATFPVLNVCLEIPLKTSPQIPRASLLRAYLAIACVLRLKLIILRSQRWLTVMIVQRNLRAPILLWITLKID